MEIAGAEIEWMQQQVQQTNHGTKYECWKNNCCHNESHYNKKKQKWLSYCISSLWFLTSNRQNGIDVSTSESWFYRIHQLTFHRNCTWTGLPWPPYIILHDLRACRDVQRMLVTFTERRLFGQFSVCMVLAACCYWLQSEDGFLLQYLVTSIVDGHYCSLKSQTTVATCCMLSNISYSEVNTYKLLCLVLFLFFQW